MVRVREGESEQIFDYILATSLRRDAEAGERLLQAGEILVAPWRGQPGVSPDLGDLISAVGDVARLRALLEVAPEAIEAVAGGDPASQGRLARVVRELAALLGPGGSPR